MVTLVSSCKLLQQGGEAAFLQPLVPANIVILSPCFTPGDVLLEQGAKDRAQLRSPLWPFTTRVAELDSWGHPGTAAQGHSPFQVGGNPHVGHLPAHSCNEREDNQPQPREGQALAPRAGHCPGSWAPWLVGKEAGGQGWGFSSSFHRPIGWQGAPGIRWRSLYLPCQSRGCFHLSTGRPNAGRCST